MNDRALYHAFIMFALWKGFTKFVISASVYLSDTSFNKTIIKLQNTSRIAEEQDQRQTDSIQILHSQLENVSKLMLNLTDTVSQLQREVSDRQSYLVVSLVLCLTLGLLLCLQCFSSYDDMSLKRRVTCPLVRSKSFHLSSTEEKALQVKVFGQAGRPLCSSHKRGSELQRLPTLPPFPPHPPPPPPPPPPSLPPPPSSSAEEASSLPTCTSSETSSCSSSTHSEESYTSRLPPPSPIRSSTDLCNGHSLPFSLQQSPTKSRQEKRSMKRRKSRQMELQFPALRGGSVGSLPSLQQLMKGNKEISVGTIG
ncbi:hypothetical protein F7725_027627 [Dissostichus mawsoni]|uniref:Uncharacterized protein n=1 Tax=Dissostichus mawsoni TaxID=36200 RepID=A0A7J5XEC7_DISMA|nr:hypothetical protein F7725_027627 [Dissostichus mawsoni]